MQDKATVIMLKYHKVKSGVETQEPIRINEHRVLATRKDKARMN